MNPKTFQITEPTDPNAQQAAEITAALTGCINGILQVMATEVRSHPISTLNMLTKRCAYALADVDAPATALLLRTLARYVQAKSATERDAHMKTMNHAFSQIAKAAQIKEINTKGSA
jgi:hypothetical protein